MGIVVGIGVGTWARVEVGTGMFVTVKVTVGIGISVGIGEGVAGTPQAETKKITRIAEYIFFNRTLQFLCKELYEKNTDF